ncbi:MAG: hypothetical protein ACK4MX_08785 [Thermaurantiacus sp.]
MKTSLSAACVAAVLLSACVPVVKRNVLRDELRDAGFSMEQAQCLSDRMAPRLSIAELNELGRYVETVKGSLRELPVPLAMLRIVNDANPRIVGAVIDAGTTCIATFVAPKRAVAG